MKFRNKILICNILFVALTFAVSGYLMIRHSYKGALNREITNMLEENQMLRTTIEADITNRILQDDYDSLSDVSILRENIVDRLKGTQTEVMLLMDSDITEDFEYKDILDNLEAGKKNYYIDDTAQGFRLVAASMLGIESRYLYIINLKDISSVYEDMNMQITYQRVLLVIAVVICSIVMFFVSYFLTLSIEKLSKATRIIAEGNYEVRTDIKSNDEIGELGQYFNQMADAVRHHVAALEDENRRREDFVANFTHEIKTPLTAVIGYSDMIRSKRMSEDNLNLSASYIFSEGKRLESMSMKLFDLILLEKDTIQKRRIYLPDFMEAVYVSAAPIMETREVQLLMQSHPVWLYGDPDLLKTVFINMLDNASKASPPGKKVLFRAREKSGVILLEVIDWGHGIPAEELKKITEAFYMVDKSRSRKSGGAGLGLTLAEKIIKLHEGKLKIVSEENKGTCIQVYFREADDHEAL